MTRVRETSSPLAFASGERWTALGDSLTHTGSYHLWLQLFHLTRHPTRELHFANCGIAGDTAAGARRRLTWDVLPTRPTLCTVMLGMNDVGLALYTLAATGAELAERRRAALRAFEKNLRALVEALRETGTRVVLVTPTIFDQWAELPAPRRPGVETALATCAEFVRRLAGELGLGLVELHEPLRQLTRRMQSEDPSATLIGPDRIHPGAVGHFAIAMEFLRAQRARGEVSAIELDVTTRAVAVRHGQVSEFQVRAAGGHEVGRVAFSWKAESLPFPVEPDLAPALRWMPFVPEFNRETLRVTGCQPGRYALRIEDDEAGVFSDAELTQGIDLAAIPHSPQMRQAREVARVLRELRQHVAETLRNIALVEHQSAPAEEQPFSWATARPNYERRLALIPPEDPANANLLRIYRLYPELKPREAENRETAERLAAEARRCAQPQKRLWELVRLP